MARGGDCPASDPPFLLSWFAVDIVVSLGDRRSEGGGRGEVISSSSTRGWGSFLSLVQKVAKITSEHSEERKRRGNVKSCQFCISCVTIQ